ncbi:MAG: hypothetical protein EP326_10430 [Deltaproteobacteria bacterium]|nr:MAG: hypothetical protein EP326_10430 [Deltaproteobacteria bacterium]TNF31024.1 MAG: hypothetical protein EP319_03440 [Deltaproteobacteria bacterium]
MFFMLKFTIYFSISFVILCIPIQNRTLFNLIHKHASPYTTQIFSEVEKAASNQIQKGSKFTKKFFSNSNPDQQDKVIAKFSSTKKPMMENVEELMKDEDTEEEGYTVEEKELLNKILKEAR